MDGVDGVLLDIDGVLLDAWKPIPGAADAIVALRDAGVPLGFLTNTTSRSSSEIRALLAEAGMRIQADELVTAGGATGRFLRDRHPDARCFVLDDGSAEALADADVNVRVPRTHPTLSHRDFSHRAGRRSTHPSELVDRVTAITGDHPSRCRITYDDRS